MLLKFHDAPALRLLRPMTKHQWVTWAGRLVYGIHKIRSTASGWSIDDGQTRRFTHEKYNGIIHPTLSYLSYNSPLSILLSSSRHPTAADVASARPNFLSQHASRIDRRTTWLEWRGIKGDLSLTTSYISAIDAMIRW